MPAAPNRAATIGVLLALLIGCSDEKTDASVDEGSVGTDGGSGDAAALREGMSVGDCTDRADNDGDGAFDCDDDGCAGSPDCAGVGDAGGDGGADADADSDGVASDDDCDDDDPALGARAQDADCDGLRGADDCDDADPASTAVAEDRDCDGVVADEDCDDLDAAAVARAADGDCDGVLLADDCDDTDTVLGDRAEDRDCDGALIGDDCDDADPGLLSSRGDFDCDGSVWPFDCDDLDASVGDRSLDGDCDGATITDDCDDRDPSSTTVLDDNDCDAVLDADDCDDLDPLVGATPDDPDCDGELEPSWGGEFVRIEAGTFDMGCTPGQLSYDPAAGGGPCSPGAAPVRSVTLTSDFWMATTEVTEAEFQGVMGYLSMPSSRRASAQAAQCVGGDCPVSYVTWPEAAAFANAVSAAAGLEECYVCIGTGYCASSGSPYSCEGYRLPTEAEFEHAARGGTDLLYAGSNDLDLVAWTRVDAALGTGTLPADVLFMPVGRRAPNACGVYDLSGNLGELSTDMWQFPPPTGRGAAVTDPYFDSPLWGPAIRGTYARNSATEAGARIANSEAGGYYASPSDYYSVGFRLVRTIPR